MFIIEKTDFGGWPNCYRLANGLIELIVTTDVGPRIVKFALDGQENVFKEFTDMQGKTGGDEWRIYGGHRFWHAPEQSPRTYYPDNIPVDFQKHEDFVRVVQPIETSTGIQKEIDLRVLPDKPIVEVTHRLRNTNLWTVELAPWALSVMAPNGIAIIPLPPRGSHPENLLPASGIITWAYTNMADSRWVWGHRHIMLGQNPSADLPQKIGLTAINGWIAYAHPNGLFVKRVEVQSDAVYPDMGSVVEVFTNKSMLEVETLGPLAKLEPMMTVEHTEYWHLFAPVSIPATESDVDKIAIPDILATI